VSGLGPLLPADEGFFHQIADTFATVSQSDRSWTEKVCAMACARDGSLQLAFGMGKYPNRGMLDAYAGASRGVEQWTVRAARPLGEDPTGTAVGPIRYEVLEPLRRVRFSLGANDVVPLRFEWTFTGAVPAFLEDREVHRSQDGYRVEADIVRYHHIGTASGWAELEGRRVELEDASWVSTRDHSWGVRYMVGAPLADVPGRPEVPGLASLVMWAPVLCQAPDNVPYGIHWFYQRHTLGAWQRVQVQGGVEHPDGTKERFVAAEPDLRFDADNRRFEQGSIRFTTAAGAQRQLLLEAASDTGFHLGAGLYFGFEGRWHGQWRPRLELEGEHVADCSDPAQARRLHQIRDCVVRVRDPAVGGVGVGNLQSIVTGPHPAMGLSEESSFV
jgi:hypothetical protein